MGTPAPSRSSSPVAPSTVSIPPGGAGAAHITDTYGSAPGSLLVTKTIAGPLAGQQGPIAIHVVCNGTALSPDFVIGAGSKAGSVSHSFDGIPAGSVCTVTETADGGTTTVAAIVAGSGQTVTVPAGTVVPVSLVDAYEQPLGGLEDVVPPLGGSGPFQPIRGYLKVIKTMTGAAARQHGPIDHPGRLWPGPRLRLPHPSARLRFCVEGLPRPAPPDALHRHRDRERSHQHRERAHHPQAHACDRARQRRGLRSTHRRLLTDRRRTRRTRVISVYRLHRRGQDRPSLSPPASKWSSRSSSGGHASSGRRRDAGQAALTCTG